MSIAFCTDFYDQAHLCDAAGLRRIREPDERRAVMPQMLKYYADKRMTLCRMPMIFDNGGRNLMIISITRDADIRYVETVFRVAAMHAHRDFETLEHGGQIWLLSRYDAFRHDNVENVVTLESPRFMTFEARVEARDGTLYMEQSYDAPISRDIGWHGLRMHIYACVPQSVCVGVESDAVYTAVANGIWRRDPRVPQPELIDHADIASLHNPGDVMYACTQDSYVHLYDERNNALVGCADPIVSIPEHMTVKHIYHI